VYIHIRYIVGLFIDKSNNMDMCRSMLEIFITLIFNKHVDHSYKYEAIPSYGREGD